jgi:hypothetical protein
MRHSSPFLCHLCAKPAPSSCHSWQWMGEDQSRAFPSPSIANRGRNLMVVPASNRENWVNAKCNGNHHQIHATISSCRFCRSCQKTLYLYDFSGFRIPKPPFFVGSMFRNLSVSFFCLLIPVSFCGVKRFFHLSFGQLSLIDTASQMAQATISSSCSAALQISDSLAFAGSDTMPESASQNPFCASSAGLSSASIES